MNEYRGNNDIICPYFFGAGVYPEHEDLDEYINSDDSIAFLYYSQGKCLGHIRLSTSDEIKFASIDRLIVLETTPVLPQGGVHQHFAPARQVHISRQRD